MIDLANRHALIMLEPETCFITEHYLNDPAMLVRLATVRPQALRESCDGVRRQRLVVSALPSWQMRLAC